MDIANAPMVQRRLVMQENFYNAARAVLPDLESRRLQH